MNSQSRRHLDVVGRANAPLGGRIGSLDRIRPALRRARETEERAMWQGLGDAWAALSTIISGVLVWGAIGYGLDRLFATRPIFFVVGAVFGNFGGIYLVYRKEMNRGVPPHAS
jgi:F0F1-type ATP synthase assembly protein I